MRIRAHIAGHLIATLWVVLWVAQPLIAIAHAQEHAHRYCPAHRTFEEASSNGDTPRAARMQNTRAYEKQPLAPPGGTPLHEECAFVSVSTRDELTSPALQPLVQACLEVSHPATAPPRPHSSLSVLDTAPKSSPPARL